LLPALRVKSSFNMSFYGLTDLLTPHEPDECPHCEGELHVGSGLCLRCLLQAGIGEEEDSGNENLDTLLAEME